MRASNPRASQRAGSSPAFDTLASKRHSPEWRNGIRSRLKPCLLQVRILPWVPMEESAEYWKKNYEAVWKRLIYLDRKVGGLEAKILNLENALARAKEHAPVAGIGRRA